MSIHLPYTLPSIQGILALVAYHTLLHRVLKIRKTFGFLHSVQVLTHPLKLIEELTIGGLLFQSTFWLHKTRLLLTPDIFVLTHQIFNVLVFLLNDLTFPPVFFKFRSQMPVIFGQILHLSLKLTLFTIIEAFQTGRDRFRFFTVESIDAVFLHLGQSSMVFCIQIDQTFPILSHLFLQSLNLPQILFII